MSCATLVRGPVHLINVVEPVLCIVRQLPGRVRLPDDEQDDTGRAQWATTLTPLVTRRYSSDY